MDNFIQALLQGAGHMKALPRTLHSHASYPKDFELTSKLSQGLHTHTCSFQSCLHHHFITISRTHTHSPTSLSTNTLIVTLTLIYSLTPTFTHPCTFLPPHSQTLEQFGHLTYTKNYISYHLMATSLTPTLTHSLTPTITHSYTFWPPQHSLKLKHTHTHMPLYIHLHTLTSFTYLHLTPLTQHLTIPQGQTLTYTQS